MIINQIQQYSNTAIQQYSNTAIQQYSNTAVQQLAFDVVDDTFLVKVFTWFSAEQYIQLVIQKLGEGQLQLNGLLTT
jgi:hypothetical protein